MSEYLGLVVEGASLIIILEPLPLSCCFTHLEQKKHVTSSSDWKMWGNISPPTLDTDPPPQPHAMRSVYPNPNQRPCWTALTPHFPIFDTTVGVSYFCSMVILDTTSQTFFQTSDLRFVGLTVQTLAVFVGTIVMEVNTHRLKPFS